MISDKEIASSLSLPEIPNPAPVVLDSSKTALIVVDMQNDFSRPSGKLFVGETVAPTIPKIQRLLKRARENRVPVIYTQDWMPPNSPEFNIWGEHCLQGSPGAEIINELHPSAIDHVIRKESYDPFFQTDLEVVLKKLAVEAVVITGTVSNICVLHTAASAALRGYRVVVPVDGISALHPFDHLAATRQISFLYRAHLTTADQINFT